MAVKKEDKVNYRKVNEILKITSKILKIAYILIFILGVYAITLIAQAWNLFPSIISFLELLAPLFIGVIFAWLLDPIANYLQRKGINRTWGTMFIITCFISILAIILAAFVPLMKEQIDQFIQIIPDLITTLTHWADNFFASLDADNATAIQDNIAASLDKIGKDLTANLPSATINFVTSFFAGLGTFLIGLVIGFYLLLHFDRTNAGVLELLPSRCRKGYISITNEMNTSLRNFVNGLFFTSGIVFFICAIGFTSVGLESPIMFALICGITNMIPYIGPYIGGFPAVIVGLTIDPTIGVLTLIVIIIAQVLESFIIQPIVMSKATKLHPVVIIIGLVIFGKFFGIIGMILATPILAVCKIIFKFLVEKYNIFNWNEIEEQS